MTITRFLTSYCKAGAITYDLGLSEPEANNNRRVITCKKKRAASRGFLATTRLSF